jgi:Uma2 family endonuclease
MSPVAKPQISPQEYLALERRSDRRNEYVDGEMWAMTGASRRHNLISLNLGAELRAGLKDRPCEVYVSDMRVKAGSGKPYFYPDVVVVCGEPGFEDEETDTLLNPTVIAEVLSKSTEAFDRGEKSRRYRAMSSLTDYLLVSQTEPRVEHYRRHSDDTWLLSETSDLDATIEIESIQAAVSLAEIYDRVDFAEGSDQTPGEAG